MAARSNVQQLMCYTALLLLGCLVLNSNGSSSTVDGAPTNRPFGIRRLLLKAELPEVHEEDRPNPPPKKTKPTTTTTNPKSKLLTKSSHVADQLPSLNIKLKKLNSTTSKNTTTLTTAKLKKLTNSTSKEADSTKSNTILTYKSLDLASTISPKDKPSKPKNLSPPNSTTTPKIKKVTEQVTDAKFKFQEKQNPKDSNSKPKPKPMAVQKSPLPSWIDQDEEEDLVSEFRDLTSKFQQTLLPDLESISQTSKAYLNEANKEMARNFKPIVGKKYAPTTANIVSFVFIILPLFLVSLLISRIKTYFSLQKLLIFINIYLAIYFSILSLSAIATGLEPLRFLFATSQSTYVGIQILQTLCYGMYLLLLVMYLVLVFSTATGLGSKILSLGQTIAGFAVGLHHYVAVFHRVVHHQPPMTNWKVHAVYATCFFVISLFASAERKKKEYLEDGGEEGKKN